MANAGMSHCVDVTIQCIETQNVNQRDPERTAETDQNNLLYVIFIGSGKKSQ